MRAVLGLCFRGSKTNTLLHSQVPALHPFGRVQAPWTNHRQGLVREVRSLLVISRQKYNESNTRIHGH